LLAPLLVALSCFAAQTEPAAEVHLNGRAMGTTYSIRALLPDPAKTPDVPSLEEWLRQRVEAELSRIDTLMSVWREDSEVSRFNAWESTEPFEISPEMVAVLTRSREMWRVTGGVFDPAIGRLVRLWGLGAWPAPGAPSPGQIAEALAASGFARLSLEGRLIRKKDPQVWIDLDGIAPGYAVDRLFEALQQEGLGGVLVELGGEVRVGSPPPGRAGFRIGVDEPRYDGGRSLYATLELANAAVSTSGDYRKWILRDGKRLSHILDPHTGRPADSGVVSATVVAPDCATADALAKALVVLGPERGIRLVESLAGVSCLLLIEDPKGEKGLKEARSAGMNAYLRER